MDSCPSVLSAQGSPLCGVSGQMGQDLSALQSRKGTERSHENLTAPASLKMGFVLGFRGDGGSRENERNPQPMDVSRLSVSRRHRHKIRTQGRAWPGSGRAGDKQNNAPGDSGGSAQGGCQRPGVAEILLPRQPVCRRATPSGTAAAACALTGGTPTGGFPPALRAARGRLHPRWCHRTGKGHPRDDAGPAPALGCSGEAPQARRRK